MGLGLLSIGLLGSTLSFSEEVPERSTIKLERAVHFPSPDGADVVLAPGAYGVEAKDEKLIIVTAIDGGATTTIQAEAGTHEERLSTPEVLTGTQEEDFFHLVLLLPGGKTLDALGTFSGVSTRAPSSMVPFRPAMPRLVKPLWNCPAPTGPGTTHGSITTAQTWTAAASPHILPSDIGISAPVTIEPCAVVRIAVGKTITINPNGALIATGAPGSAVLIEPQVAGMAWSSIRNMGGTLSLSHAVVRGGGAPLGTNPAYTGALRMESPGPAIGMLHVDDVEIADSLSQGIYIRGNGEGGFDPTSQNLYIHGSAGYPVHVFARVIGSIPSGAYADNGRPAIAISGSGGPVLNGQTMHDRGVPYHVGSGQDGGRMDVSTQLNGPPAVLTIEPGVMILFPLGGSLNINASGHGGTLIAVGTPTRPIVFTSDKGAASAAGDWLGIGFDDPVSTQSVIQFARVAFAGGSSTFTSNSCPYPNRTGQNYGAIRIFGPTLTEFITSTEISFSGRDGIDRGWRANPQPDFLATNMFTGVAGCKQTTPRTQAGACPVPVPCP
jgi:hypothetical protein